MRCRLATLGFAALALCLCVAFARSAPAAASGAHAQSNAHAQGNGHAQSGHRTDRGRTSGEIRERRPGRPGGHARHARAEKGANPPPSHAQKLANPLASHDLWATIDICKESGPPTIGVRGSMPSNGHPHYVMYMQFKLQYHDVSTGKWVDLPNGTAPSGYVKVGRADVTRQGGRSFQLAPGAAEGEFELRGLVYFQWRNQSKVALSALRPTTSGHKDAVGAVPHGFSAATCAVQ